MSVIRFNWKLAQGMAQIPYSLMNHSKRGTGGLCTTGAFGSRRLCSLLLTFLLFATIFFVFDWGMSKMNDTTIIIITPTHQRPERLADMTRFAQTLMHIRNIHWVVIEDSNATVPAVERILQRSRIPYVYFYTTTKPGFPRRGWTHRNMGLEYIRKNYRNYRRNAVVYFADDDNSYDIRLFDRYIRKVKTLGIWAVGLAGGALVEAPHVENGTITKFDVMYAPSRKFATDMAGFALGLPLVLNSNASFHQGCVKVSPESCFLSQFKLERKDAQPFGYNDDPKEILVWHTKTKNIGVRGTNHGYITER
ncbi:Galactosylgalactosylxylosylprotein 3-beta-glucuronosyltransferase [Aphelenchoides besseyi]|nr:Galactosylgalactosylxylosylprotein 3-beta-glucuronosyltransferase [Aphelenchoides besseyi]